jgi:hypothetical protein
MEPLDGECMRLVQMPDGSYRYRLVAWNAEADVWETVAEQDAQPADLVVWDEAGREVTIRTQHVFLGVTD